MSYGLRLITVLVCVLVSLEAAPARAERRVALVIGNSLYGHHAALPNVPNDAATMAALLKGAGFDKVDVRSDLGIAALRLALQEFHGAAANADVAVLFYAGHGIEVNGTNYLIPVDARLATDYVVEDETVALDRVLQAMEPAQRLRLVILDACRENPFLKSMKRTVAGRSVGRGLGRVEPTAGNTLIAFATKPNAIALDGKGPNSPFTAALVKHLATPGHDVRLALGDVRDHVLASTGGKQEPYVTSSLGSGTFAIVGGTPKPVATPPGQLSEAAEAWAAVKDSGSIAQLEIVAKRYERSVYADLAKARIDELKKLAMVAPSQVKPEPPKAVTVAPDLTPGRVFRDCPNICPEMVVVPAGSFMMGSNEYDSEKPQRKVTIARPFAVGKFEVTFAEWDACVADRGCQHRPGDEGWGRGRRPVINVSWHDVKEYVGWLSRKTGKTYRLLSEAEWEYAARAGTTTRYAFGDTISKSQAQFQAGQPAEVGSFAANKFGLHDFHGNVWEWVEDSLHPNYTGAPLDGTVWPGGDVSLRVLRGGAWDFTLPDGLRSASRSRYYPTNRIILIGFRVARTL
jgi:formylglycine-generating enzyme required for sulfatase activity